MYIFQTLCSLTREEALRRLMTYTTFFVARHPFERLVSAYFNKFVGGVLLELGRSITLDQARIYFPQLHFDQIRYST